ncbi:MAG TPA: transglutaminase family protein [Pirellulales bacterium]|nr:transglutaminase family protein [Pirellulales bacterium]
MSIRVALNHRTSYRYDRPVAISPHVVRLRPAPHCRTPIVSYSLRVRPETQFLNWQQDPYGNFLARFVFPEPASELSLEVDLIAEMTVINPFDFFLEHDAIHYPFSYDDWLRAQLAPFLMTAPVGPRFQSFLAAAPHNPAVTPQASTRTVDFLVDVNSYVHRSVKYVIRLEPGVQTPEQTLEMGTGSCRDSAWLLVQTLRHLGLAARFVSGYLIQLKPDVKPLEGPAGAEHDFTDLHAWAEVYLPGAGWVGMDPTSGLLAGEGHLPLAATPEPFSAAPISGSVDPCEVDFKFEMSVRRIHEDPRVTKPYTDEQWTRIESLGHEVDRLLDANNVRLTMGGEPTFVSVDDMDGAEWNTTALGPHKRELAGKLFCRLADRFATGPLMHYGQGKWYPGESLPRWALGCYWRCDGEPVWRKPEFIAKDEVHYGFDENHAQRFVTSLAERLEVGAEHAIAAYEDAWYYLWKERRLPANVDPFDSKLENAEDRARLAKVFEDGLQKTVGYALPLRVHTSGPDKTEWASGPWFFRPERMYLIPGDSAMGYRLPLDSLPWTVPGEDRQIYERDPFADRGPLPQFSANGFGNGYPWLHRPSQATARRQYIHQVAGVSGLGDAALGEAGYGEFVEGLAGTGLSEVTGEFAPATALATDSQSATSRLPKSLVRTAVCVEARQGTLHVFMPPVGRAEDYLRLVQAIEATAEELALPVRIEGYTPPHDYRLQHFKVTPDPGVIEVNLQPVRKWDDLVRNTTTLYDEAHQSRLGTEKFMLDGRHTGTGGGNHLVLGGGTPQESPFLRRPDLLRSLIAYWNNRPSLSYLFSGLFVGPTSQAPRVDEARHEAVYELETAFTQLPLNGSQFPWMVDRVLRNLLVDVTGNTHRAEFCIDKLFSPDTAHGRLGLVEFRAFEMPPHARMSLTQQLLMRALVSRFWTEAYRAPLVHWSTALHDRFMLPHFVAQDFQEVLEELRTAGYPFEQDWFASHFEFRYPILGQVTQRNVEIELRQAIEPWNVLGEEPAGGATARYVDSSVERLQVKVRGMTDPRHVLACNGRRVPLHPTGTPGEFVAGIRYRAWQPPNCLHPTIGVHAPLVFDLMDLWNSRSVGGCTLHVSHPGGRSFDRFPVNAYEAESRRGARFFGMGHTGGKLRMPATEHNRDYPMTLDLRRPIELATMNE